MNAIRIFFIFYLLGVTPFVYAQSDTLTLEDAIYLTLENNQEIAIQRKQTDIARNNVYRGNAGLLPTISLIGNGSYSSGTTDVALRTFSENPSQISIEEDNVVTQQASGVVQADYVLFGGFSGQYRYRLLEHAATMSRYQQEVVVNNTILLVAELFVETAKLQRQEELLRETIAISEDRLARVNDQFSFGKATGLDVLRAETNLNEDRSTLDDVSLAKNNMFKDLNFFIGQEAETEYAVSVTYQVPGLITLDSLKQQVLQSNPERKLQAESLLAAQDQRKLTQADRYPRLSAFVNYGYQWQQNDVQQLAELRNIGYTAGVSFRYNLYQGGRTRRNLQNDRLAIEAEEVRLEQVRERLVHQAIKEYSTLEYLQAQLEREQRNLETFTESFRRSQERYYNGKATSLDIRDTQTALLNANIVISNLQADIITSFIRLEKLRGGLFTSQP